ncbi:MAG: 3'-5' exonuclease [Pirellulales bacterium]|nr:3'-5' exonuclease [Pirellulales bacterium]
MNQTLVFFDLETGGIDPKRHPIIQIAAIAVGEDLEPIEAFEAKIRFSSKTATASSLRKSSYHPGVWAKEGREPAEVAKELAGFLRRHATRPALTADGKKYQVAQLVAHNAAFDGPFISEWFDRLRVYLPARKLVLCTLQLALWNAQSQGGTEPANFQLATLCRHYGVPFHAASAHDALGDVSATVGLFQAIARSMQTSSRAAA